MKSGGMFRRKMRVSGIWYVLHKFNERKVEAHFGTQSHFEV